MACVSTHRCLCWKSPSAPKGWFLRTSLWHWIWSVLVIARIIFPFQKFQSIRQRVPWGRRAPSSSPHSLRGWFSWSPHNLITGVGAWWVRTPVQTLWADPPVGIGRLVPPPWRSVFLRLCPWRCIFETALGFVVTLQFRALVIGSSPWFFGDCMGCAAAQTQILSVPCTPRPSLSARGICVGLLQGSTPQTPYFRWSIDVDWSVLLLSVLCRSSEG